MLALSTAFKNFLYSQQVIKPLVKLYFEKTGIDPIRGLKSYHLYLHELITNFGSISRELSLDIGMFRAGSHSFDLSNTKDLGDYLFTLRKRFGLTSWIDKTYHIAWGFKEAPITTSVIAGIPYLSTLGYGAIPSAMRAGPTTLGYGDTPSGEETIESATEEVINIYTGDIYNKNEDRTGDKVKVQSKDILKRIADFKICELLIASDVYAYTVSGDYENMGYQQILKYGTHKLCLNDTKAIKDRNNPFSATLGFPNKAGATIPGVTIHNAHYIWYFPFVNSVSIDISKYTSGTLKMYYWDYRNSHKVWRTFLTTDFGPASSINLTILTNKGIYAYINPGILPTLVGGTWVEYISGIGATWVDNNPDPMVCIETESQDYYGTTDHNPVKLIFDLLTSDRFLNFGKLPDVSEVDFSTYDLATINTDYSFDETYRFFDGESALINTSISKETSILKVIESIAKICGMYFFTSCKKAVGEDRRIRLKYNKSVSPCVDKPTAFMQFSTKDVIKNLNAVTSSNEIKDKVINVNYDESVSTPDNFDIRISGTGDRVLSLAASKNPVAYFYNSGNAAESIALRIFDQFNLPLEKYTLDLNHHGMPLELSDYIKLIDHKTGEILIAQIFKWTFRLYQAKVALLCKRYTKMFGPDPENPYKKWAFIDCAYVDNDQVGGNAITASLPIGTDTVTLAGGETIDLDIVKVGMDLTLQGDHATNYEHFRIKELISATQFKIEESLEGGGDVASKNHINVQWSIGNSYHVY